MILCLQHVPFETPGHISAWAHEHKIPMHLIHCYQEQAFPEPSSFELLVIMGGPMSVHDEKKHPWISGEKRFIERSIGAGKKILGICLGAQMIADVMGAKVYKNSYREIGWFEVKKIASKNSISNLLPERFMAFHWHGEIFEIPSGASQIAATEACENQGFAYREKVLGLQFHLEIREEGVKGLLVNCADELDGSRFVQSREEIMKGLHHADAANALMHAILEKLYR